MKAGCGVILHNRQPVTPADIQYCPPAFHGKDRCGRVLVTGIYVNKFRVVEGHQFFQPVGHHAVPVHRHGKYPAACQFHETVNIRGARFFNDDSVAGLDQRGDNEIQGLIRFRKDLDLAGPGIDAFVPEVKANLLQQFLIPLIGRNVCRQHGPSLQRLFHHLADLLGCVEIGRHAGGHGNASAAVEPSVYVVIAPVQVKIFILNKIWPVDRTAAPGRLCRLRVRTQGTCHPVSQALMGFYEVHILQLLIGADHRVSVDAQLLCQPAFRGEHGALYQIPQQYGPPDLPGNLHIHGALQLSVKYDAHGCSPFCGGITRQIENH